MYDEVGDEIEREKRYSKEMLRYCAIAITYMY